MSHLVSPQGPGLAQQQASQSLNSVEQEGFLQELSTSTDWIAEDVSAENTG